MKIESLSIRQKLIIEPVLHYELRGTVKFTEEEFGSIEILLDEESVKRIIGVCADTLERVSRESAQKLHKAIVGAIEISGAVLAPPPESNHGGGDAQNRN